MSDTQHNTELIASKFPPSAMQPHGLYQRIENPMEAAEQVGKWLTQMGACKTPGEGAIFAMSALYHNKDITEMIREYMVVFGKLTRKYQLLLVDLRKAGGDYRWIATGDDGKAATIEIYWNGRTESYTYTMDMAQQAGVMKADSGWQKIPGNMLRSKAVRNALDMYCPEVSAGYAIPEDFEGEQISHQPTARVTATPKAKVEPVKYAPQPESQPEPEPVAETEPQQYAVDQNDVATPVDIPPKAGKASAEQVRQIYELGGRLGFTPEQIKTQAENGKHGTAPENYTSAQALEVIASLGKHIESKRNAAK